MSFELTICFVNNDRIIEKCSDWSYRPSEKQLVLLDGDRVQSIYFTDQLRFFNSVVKKEEK